MTVKRGGRGPFHSSRSSGHAGDGTSAPTLQVLTLGASSLTENSAQNTIIGPIQNMTNGSTPSLADSASNKVAILNGNLVAGSANTDFDTVGSPFTCTVRETLAGAVGSPKDTIFTITVVNANDTNPSAFTFTDATSVVVSATQTSNAITIAGLGASDSVTASVSGAASSEMSINGGAWTSIPATVVNGDTIAVRHTSSGSNSTAVNTVLTAGTTSDTYTSTTVGASNAALATLTDNFNAASIDSAKWDTGNFYAPAAATVGTVTSSTSTTVKNVPGTSTPGYNGLISHNLYDLTGSSAYVKLNIGNLSTNEQAYFSVGPDNNHLYLFYKDGGAGSGTLVCAKKISGTPTTIASVAWSASTVAWYRIRESGGTIFFDYAPSSASNPPISGDWTNLGSAVIDSSAMPDKTAIKVGMGSGTSVGAATVHNFFIDGFNSAT